MALALGGRVRSLFSVPRYLASPFAGIEISASGVKAAELSHGAHGLILSGYSEAFLSAGVYNEGEIADRRAVIHSIRAAALEIGSTRAHIALPETRSFLFETTVSSEHHATAEEEVRSRLPTLVPLPPSKAVFQIVPRIKKETGEITCAGVALDHRIVAETLSLFDEAHIEVYSVEPESFSVARALFPHGDESTALIIDVGKSATKLTVVSARILRYAATVPIGGHALTLAIQKQFGVTEHEARRVKAEQGILRAGESAHRTTMLETLALIRKAIEERFGEWQARVRSEGNGQVITHAVLAGGNASLRGLAEYLEDSLRVPVRTGDVFTNLASRDEWLPPLEYGDSLAYAAAIGLALRGVLES